MGKQEKALVIKFRPSMLGDFKTIIALILSIPVYIKLKLFSLYLFKTV